MRGPAGEPRRVRWRAEDHRDGDRSGRPCQHRPRLASKPGAAADARTMKSSTASDSPARARIVGDVEGRCGQRPLAAHPEKLAARGQDAHPRAARAGSARRTTQPPPRSAHNCRAPTTTDGLAATARACRPPAHPSFRARPTRPPPAARPVRRLPRPRDSRTTPRLETMATRRWPPPTRVVSCRCLRVPSA